MHIRTHRRTDADRIAEILAAGWAQAYSRFMPADILQPRVDPERRKIEIAEWLEDEFDPAVEALFVAENEGGVGGFIHMELGDKGGLGATGIVNLLYVDAALQGRGVGRALMAAGARWLMRAAPGSLVLSAYADNHFRHAYTAMGGHEAKQVVSSFNGHDLSSVLYLWPDPTSLFRLGG